MRQFGFAETIDIKHCTTQEPPPDTKICIDGGNFTVYLTKSGWYRVDAIIRDFESGVERVEFEIFATHLLETNSFKQVLRSREDIFTLPPFYKGHHIDMTIMPFLARSFIDRVELCESFDFALDVFDGYSIIRYNILPITCTTSKMIFIMIITDPEHAEYMHLFASQKRGSLTLCHSKLCEYVREHPLNATKRELAMAMHDMETTTIEEAITDDEPGFLTVAQAVSEHTSKSGVVTFKCNNVSMINASKNQGPVAAPMSSELDEVKHKAAMALIQLKEAGAAQVAYVKGCKNLSTFQGDDDAFNAAIAELTATRKRAVAGQELINCAKKMCTDIAEVLASA